MLHLSTTDCVSALIYLCSKQKLQINVQSARLLAVIIIGHVTCGVMGGTHAGNHLGDCCVCPVYLLCAGASLDNITPNQQSRMYVEATPLLPLYRHLLYAVAPVLCFLEVRISVEQGL